MTVREHVAYAKEVIEKMEAHLERGTKKGQAEVRKLSLLLRKQLVELKKASIQETKK